MSILNHFPTGGGISDTLTATPEDVMKGFKFVGLLQDDVEIGTLELTGNALINHVTKDKTFYTTNPKQIMTGIMEVNNASNLVLSLASGRNVIIKWTNPKVTTGRPYSGVYVRYQTGSYPTPTTGTQGYKGVGSTSSAGSVSQVTLALPNLDTTYYFIVYSYCTTSNGELIGSQLKGTIKTGNTQTITIKSNQNYTVPAGYKTADIFCVGGGGGNYSSSKYYSGGGAGGGYTKTVSNIGISSGQVLSCTIGGSGGATSVSRSGTVLCIANGGKQSSAGTASEGGSGGGGYTDKSRYDGGNGGSNGGGGSSSGAGAGALGQGTTTRAFGESSGALYSGGGGGGAYYSSSTSGGAGGAGGGGAGGRKSSRPGQNGAANTGGGAGGGFQSNTSSPYENPDNSSQGGSGIILIRLK